MSTYHTIITNAGKQLFANAINSSNKVNISHLSLGDGNGNMPTPNATRTRLVNERTKVAVNDVKINASNANWLEVSAIIPSNNGGYTVREIGLYAGNTLVAIGNFPATYKPSANEGGAREMSIKVVIALENASVVNVSLDNSLVYATQKWVEQNFVNHNEVVNNLTSTDTTKPLSANMGRSLQGQIDTIDNKKLGKTDNAVSSSKLATPRTITLTGDVSGQTGFDGSANVGIGVTLANTGVQAGTYQSLTVDAKGRVTNGQTVLNSLITATTATGTANQATGNTNTYLNLVTRTGTSTHSQGSSTKITGTNGISVSSDTAGALTIAGTRASDTAVGVTQLSHNTNGTDKTKAASEFALGEVRRMANQAQVTADGIALTWNNVQNKPSTFTPSTHRHNWSEIDGKPSTYPPSTHSHDWNSITGKPATFEPSTHTHQYISAVDDRTLRNVRVPPRALSLYFMHRNGIRSLANTTKDYGDFLVLNSYGDNTGGKTNALFFSKESNEIIHHQAEVGSGSAWEIGKTLAYKDDNVASASKLQTPRTINGVAFDGTQNIELSAPTIWNGDLRTAEELNNAKKSGFYRVLKNPAISALELYDYGLLYVHKIDDVIQQTYFAHVPNAKGGCATRQTWTGDWNNGNNKWRIIDAPLQNSLTSTATDQALTAAQGKILNETKANISHTHTTQQLTDFNIRGISATENLNDILTSGLYTQVLTANASLSRNYPVANAGTLVVMPSAYGWQQEYTTWDTGEKYVRNRTHQTQNIWSNWLRIDGADWSSLRNKPSTFTPSSHTHSWGEIDGKPSTFTPSQHTHDWNSITGKPTTLVHTTGATFTGSITVPDLITQKLRSSEPVGLLQENNGNAQRLYTGGLLASNVYSDSSLIPENGIFAKGQIRTTSGFVGDLSGNSSTATKLQTPRNIALTGAVTGSVSFDGSQNVSITALLTGESRLQENGYMSLPNGLLLQWGKEKNRQIGSVTFPKKFPQMAVYVNATPIRDADIDNGNTSITNIKSLSASGFSFSNGVEDAGMDTHLRASFDFVWFAIGF